MQDINKKILQGAKKGISYLKDKTMPLKDKVKVFKNKKTIANQEQIIKDTKQKMPYIISAIPYLILAILVLVFLSGTIAALFKWTPITIQSSAFLMKTGLVLINFFLHPLFLVPIVLTAFTLKKDWHPMTLILAGILLIAFAIVSGVIATIDFGNSLTENLGKKILALFKPKKGPSDSDILINNLAMSLQVFVWGGITFYLGTLIQKAGGKTKIEKYSDKGLLSVLCIRLNYLNGCSLLLRS